MSRPEISIVIPTCNRQDYLVDCISVVREHYPEAEVVVSDNSDDARLREQLAPFISTGLVLYAYHKERLSVVDNFSRALDMASGQYLMFIGDDDSIGPELKRIVRWAIENNVDATVSYTNRFLANYFWPGVVSKYFGDGYQARLFIRTYSGAAIKLDGKRSIVEATRMFGHGPGEMPRLYQGIVSSELVGKIRAKYGCVFGGVSPDIFSAALLSYECENAYRIDFPFVIPGGSAPSTAGQGAARSDVGGLFEVDHIARFGSALEWNELIPDFYAPTNVWAYSFACALNKIDDASIRPRYTRLYVKDLLQYASYRKQTRAAAFRYRQRVGLVRYLSEALISGFGELHFHVEKLLRFALDRKIVIDGLPTISAAYVALDANNKRAGIKFSPAGNHK